MSDDGLDPVARLGTSPPLDASTDARIRAKVLGLLDDDGVEPPAGFAVEDDVVVDLGAPEHRRREGSSRWALRATLAASVAAVVLLVVFGLVRAADDPLPSMQDLASAARSGPYTTIDDGQQLVVVTDTESVGVFEQRTEKRVNPDGSGTERVLFEPNGTDTTNEYGPGELAVGGVPYPLLADLPTDAADLEAAVTDLASGDEASASRLLIDLLSTTATPPGVRGAAVDALVDRGAQTEEVDDTLSIVLDQPDGMRLVATVDLDQGVVTTLDARGEAVNERTQFLGTTVEAG